MQVFIGRLTDDAKVNTLKDERQVVNFSIAMNHSYTPKGGERKKQTTFVSCAYWNNTGIAQYLKKGGLVELCGNISVHAYNDLKGEAKGVLNFHVNSIQLHSSSSRPENTTPAPTGRSRRKAASKTVAEETIPAEDLPF